MTVQHKCMVLYIFLTGFSALFSPWVQNQTIQKHAGLYGVYYKVCWARQRGKGHKFLKINLTTVDFIPVIGHVIIHFLQKGISYNTVFWSNTDFHVLSIFRAFQPQAYVTVNINLATRQVAKCLRYQYLSMHDLVKS